MTEQVNRPADMIDNDNLGTWMNWSDIVKAYLDRWGYLTDITGLERIHMRLCC